MPSTDSFTSSAVAAGSPVATLTTAAATLTVFTLRAYWQLTIAAVGVVISKASSFGGSQSAPVFPVTRDAARELGEALLEIAG